MKTINYCGMTFEVEDRFKYVATDSDGSIWVYENKPRYIRSLELWLSADGGDYQRLESNFKQAEDSLENI